MAARFADRPEWIRATRAIAERCEFTLEDLGYRFPDFPVPAGETQSGLAAPAHLRGRARALRDSPARRARAHSSSTSSRVIEKLDLAGYFLIV